MEYGIYGGLEEPYRPMSRWDQASKFKLQNPRKDQSPRNHTLLLLRMPPLEF